jgi:plastocyanin domain-containing protein
MKDKTKCITLPKQYLRVDKIDKKEGLNDAKFDVKITLTLNQKLDQSINGKGLLQNLEMKIYTISEESGKEEFLKENYKDIRMKVVEFDRK